MDLKTAPLLDHLEESRAMLDEYIARKYNELRALKTACDAEKQKSQATVESLKSQKIELEAQLSSVRQTVEARESQIDAVLAEVANLRQSADELPAQLSEKARALEAEQKSLEARKADVEEKKKGRQLRKNELSKGVTFYKERLGLSFEKMPDGSLAFRMVKIDPQNHARPFTFSVLVNSKNRYEVVRCEPKVDFEPLLVDLNQTNNFSGFVQAMRRKFKALV